MLNKQMTVPGVDDGIAQATVLTASAERELSAFMLAVRDRFGVQQAYRSALDWIEELKSIHWPADGSPPNWRIATRGASIRLGKMISGGLTRLDPETVGMELPFSG
jgi:hypothetical protein